jgi:transcriptional regulator with XRE-family HTH domain
VRRQRRRASARRGLGAELASYRRAIRYSQAQLARLTDYSRSTIANVETGRQHVPRVFWEHADIALRTGGTLAAAHDQAETAARHRLQTAARNITTARQANTWQQHPGSQPDLPGPEPGRDIAAQPRPALASLETVTWNHPDHPERRCSRPAQLGRSGGRLPGSALQLRIRMAARRSARVTWPACAACACT